MVIPNVFIIPMIVSNLFAVIMLPVSMRFPNVARAAFVVIFLLSGIINAIMALVQPAIYADTYGELALFPVYRNLILGTFSQYANIFVIIIAATQFLISLLLTWNGCTFAVGAIGGIIFLLAIAPLGAGSAFPATVFLALALIITAFKIPRNN